MKITRRQALGAGIIAAGTGAAAAFTKRTSIEGTASEIPFQLCAPTDSSLEPGSLDFWIAGDSGMATVSRTACTRSLHKLQSADPAAFTILTGDNFYPHGVTSAEAPEWEEHVEETFGRLQLPIYPCLGNHDHAGSIAAQIERTRISDTWRMPAPFHSFTYGIPKSTGAEFFVIDTQDLRLSSALFSKQIEWMERSLASSRAHWKVVVGHHPLVTGGEKPVSQTLVRLLGEMFHEHGVHFYLSGHCHTLELHDSGHGWAQLISGAFAAPQLAMNVATTRFANSGGGFTRIRLQNKRAEIRFHDTDGSMLKTLEWRRA